MGIISYQIQWGHQILVKCYRGKVKHCVLSESRFESVPQKRAIDIKHPMMHSDHESNGKKKKKKQELDIILICSAGN